MGRHTGQDGHRPLRTAALTSFLALGAVGALTAAGLLTAHPPRHPDRPSSDTVALAVPATAAPAPTPPPSPSPSPSPAADPAPQTSPGTPLGVTTTAPDDAESRRVGALFSGPVAPGHHFCTASVIDSPGRNLILTAAHCLSTASGTTFVPGYRDGRAPYGSWQVTKIYTADGWRNSGDPDEDFAILAVAPRDGRQIEDAVGGNPIGTHASWTALTRLYGYPANAELPLLCTNTTTRQDTYQRRIDCPAFPGGTSGGPFVDTATGEVIGVIGGYQQGGDTADTSYSAAFDHTIAELLAEAS
ncbi:trypsin-like serine peptidase [Kitasatospora sp. NPDC057198]|uniref:trypsin-like serine peptidase n=1 Tax=Kitasatospora sp. NPDC057198 TaxID=3346046 RepID=UPI003642BF70